MPYLVEMSGFAVFRLWPRREQHTVRCFARFSDPLEHDQIVEDHFRDYLNYDIAEMRRLRPQDFFAPHNVARALLQYCYFRPRRELFDDHGCDDSLDETRLPNRPPEIHAITYDLWIESPEIG